MTKIIRKSKHVRGPVGTLLKWLFIAFNILMVVWLFAYWGDVGPLIDSGSSAEQAGAAVGSAIGTGLILIVWVIGTVILGIPVLMTKGKLVEMEETVPSESDKKTDEGLKSKLKSFSKQVLLLLGFFIFLLSGLTVVSDNFIGGIGIICAGFLFFPTVQQKLKNTPINSPKALGVAMLIIVCLSLFLGAMGDSPSSRIENLQQKAAKAEKRQKNLKQEAQEAFNNDPDTVLQEISDLAENMNWAGVKSKTKLLLDTGNEEIKNFHEQALNEIKKAEEERGRQETERLTNEFTEKRSTLVSDLNEALNKGEYRKAVNLGTPYLSVADDEFKELHDTAVEQQKVEASAAPWYYSHKDDPMSNGVTHTASLASSNTVNFDFPYSGAQRGRLALRTSPEHGKDVIFNIEKGQILCPSYDTCTIRVRFDDEDAVSYTAIGPADNSTETIFIRNYSAFVGKMMKSKRIRISMNIYNEGAPVFDFDVSGFNVAKYKPPK